MKYRSRTEIASQILEAGLGRTTKTKIMYKAFLSYAQLKEYLDVLTANGLLDYQQSEGTYRTTAKGRKFLELYNDMGRLITINKSKSTVQNRRR
jgi:predicted transcriptional regulator